MLLVHWLVFSANSIRFLRNICYIQFSYFVVSNNIRRYHFRDSSAEKKLNVYKFMTKLKLGTVVITPGAEAIAPFDEFSPFLQRHTDGDYGDLCKEDKRTNKKALKYPTGQIMSEYQLNGKKFWIITNWSPEEIVTTILDPMEY